MLRTEVGKNITARLTPTLEFQLDAIPENAAHIEDLLARGARARHRGGGRSRRAPQYAGDEDPYVKPRGEDDDDEDERRRAHPSPTTRSDSLARDGSAVG